MPWEAWVLILYFMLNLVVTAYQVGRPPVVSTGVTVCAAIVMYSFLGWCVLRLVAL